MESIKGSKETEKTVQEYKAPDMSLPMIMALANTCFGSKSDYRVEALQVQLAEMKGKLDILEKLVIRE